MQTSTTITEITKAIVQVMAAVKGIDKSINVGTGNSSYKGVADQDVKIAIGKAMEAAGLALVPTGVEPTLQIERWEESTNYGNKQKQQVFTEVKTKYLLLHTSGEWMELSGYGHGVDTQDKAAGKATTYALKYTLLYTFMVPTGKIDDADNTHSDEMQAPPAKQSKQNKAIEKPQLVAGTSNFDKVVAALKGGGFTIADVEKKYILADTIKRMLEQEIQQPA